MQGEQTLLRLLTYRLFRYLQENQRTSKINTVLKTGHLEGQNISIIVNGKIFTLKSVIFHHGMLGSLTHLYNLVFYCQVQKSLMVTTLLWLRREMTGGTWMTTVWQEQIIQKHGKAKKVTCYFIVLYDYIDLNNKFIQKHGRQRKLRVIL